MFIEFRNVDDIWKSGNSFKVLNFYNQYCHHCIEIKPFFEKDLPHMYPNMDFIAIEVSKFPMLSKQNNISATPTFIFISNNQVIDKVQGSNRKLLLETINKYTKQTKLSYYNPNTQYPGPYTRPYTRAQVKPKPEVKSCHEELCPLSNHSFMYKK